MIPLLLLLVSSVSAATVLEVTYGVLGRGFDPVGASKIHRLMEQEDWKNAAILWEGLAASEPEWEEEAFIWRVICLAKDGNFAAAQVLLSEEGDDAIEARRI